MISTARPTIASKSATFKAFLTSLFDLYKDIGIDNNVDVSVIDEAVDELSTLLITDSGSMVTAQLNGNSSFLSPISFRLKYDDTSAYPMAIHITLKAFQAVNVINISLSADDSSVYFLNKTRNFGLNDYSYDKLTISQYLSYYKVILMSLIYTNLNLTLGSDFNYTSDDFDKLSRVDIKNYLSLSAMTAI